MTLPFDAPIPWPETRRLRSTRLAGWPSVVAAILFVSPSVSSVQGQEGLQPILPERVGRTYFTQAGEPVLNRPARVGSRTPSRGVTAEAPASEIPPEFERVNRLPKIPGNVERLPFPSPSRQRDFDRFVDRTVDPDNTLEVIVSRPRLLVLRKAPLRYQIADEDIAAAEVISENEISVSGRDVGTTVLNLWFADEESPDRTTILSYLVRVHPDPEFRIRMEQIYEALEEELNNAFPDSAVEIAFVGNEVIVRGQAKDIVDATMILRTVASNSPRRRNNSPIEQLNLQFTAPIDPDADPVEQAQLRGEQSAEFLQAVTAARQQGVVNLLRVPGEQQVMLRVTVAEVNRSAARNIGLNFQVVNDSGVPVFSQLTGGLISSAASGGTSGVTTLAGNLPTILDNGQIPIAINALRTLGLARSLAEPNLVTTNGQMARFHAGGSFPVPVVTGATSVGLQGVAYVPFGVQLTFTPTITDRDRVRLLVAATVSTRDESIGTNIGSSGGSGGSSSGGSNVPGLQSRNFMTTVELREGQTLAVAGLIQNNYGANSSRVPFAGDLPFLGRLFSNSGASSQEQELVVLITPELVHPLPSGEQPALPGSDIFEPDDCEFYLLGRMESRRSEDFRSAVRTDYQRLKADRRCQQQFIIGPTGYSDGRY